VIFAVGMTVSKILKGQRLEGSCHNKTDYKSLQMQFRTKCTIELECELESVFFKSCRKRIWTHSWIHITNYTV